MAWPNSRVTNLAVTRDGNKIKASWKNPGSLTKGDRAATSIDIRALFDRAGVKPTETDVWYSNRGAERPLSYTAADRFWAKGYERAGSLPTSFEKNYDRSRFHPISPGKTLKRVQVGVAGWALGFAPWTWANYNFGLPRAPKVTWAYNEKTAVATVTVETNEGKDAYERYDTVICVKIRMQNGKERVLMGWSATRSTKWSKSWDLSGYITNMQAGKWVSVRAWAYARGIAGDNPSQAKAVYAERNICFPVSSAPGTPTCDRKEARGRIKVPVTRSGWWVTVQLQRKVGDGSWSDVSGAMDNQEKGTISLYDSYGDVMPEPGERVWYRIKTTRDNYTSYSAAVRADCLYTAPPKIVCTASAAICQVTPNATGTEAAVVMGFTDSTANTGCELSWSDSKNAWNSTDPPSTHQFTGADGTRAASAKKYNKSRTVNLANLTPNTTYYCRVRRYRTVDGNTLYSGYSGIFAFTARANAASSRLGIVSVDPVDSGTGAKVVVGWTESTAYDGTELSWSTDADAWRSNVRPETMQATWEDAARQSTAWTKTQTIYLRNLELGRTYYIRARRYKGDAWTDYTNPVSLTLPATATSSDVRCGLVSLEPMDDGKSAKAVVGWDGDRSGCELSWSADPNAWESSSAPQSFEFAWVDSESASADWSHTSTAYITGLEEGETYYVRARSYYDSEPRAWSDYTADATVTPYAAPEAVVLDSPAAVARGEAIECWWSVQSEQEQAEWHMHDASSPLTAIAEGTGSLCRATIEPERYGDADSISFYVEAGCGGGLTRSNTVTVGIADAPSCEAYRAPVLDAQPAAFEVCTNDPGARLLAACYSDGCTFEGAEGPRDQLAGDCVWTQAMTPAWQQTTWGATQLRASLQTALSDAQDALSAAQAAFEGTDEYPALAAAQSNLDAAQAALDALDPEEEGYDAALEAYQAAFAAWEPAYAAAYATAEGAAYSSAQGTAADAQAALDAHPADGEIWSATVQMPVSELYDGGGYYTEFRTVESVAQLTSGAAAVPFAVAYAHQAPEPNATVTVDAAARSVDIAFAAPEDATAADAGDLYDLYRMTPCGWELVKQGLALDAHVVDHFAPYGHVDTAYRVAVRTPDGDEAWAEFPYEMSVYTLRLDWAGESLELPWNNEIRESLAKDYEARKHASGDVNGYFDRAVEFSGSYSTDIIKVEDAALLRAARRMGAYAGAVWVRDAHGKAMQANVTLDEAAISYGSKAVGLSLAFSAMKTTGQYMPEVGKEEDDG